MTQSYCRQEAAENFACRQLKILSDPASSDSNLHKFENELGEYQSGMSSRTISENAFALL